jgi:hypothetical protein
MISGALSNPYCVQHSVTSFASPTAATVELPVHVALTVAEKMYEPYVLLPPTARKHVPFATIGSGPTLHMPSRKYVIV